MNPFEMVVTIVAIVMVASVIKARYRAGRDDDRSDAMVRPDPEADRLRGEVTQLKDRIAVLERLVTDTHGAQSLDREIERLR